MDKFTEQEDFFNQYLPRITKDNTQNLILNPENAGNGLMKLVLSLVELLRQTIEKQAIRKIESTNLSEEQIENLGLTLMKLEEKMEELKQQFGFTDKDLEINLGEWADIQ
jgi:hypothetical protein